MEPALSGDGVVLRIPDRLVDGVAPGSFRGMSPSSAFRTSTLVWKNSLVRRGALRPWRWWKQGRPLQQLATANVENICENHHRHEGLQN
jgi:hypothetical protein